MMDWKIVLFIWFFTMQLNITAAQHGVMTVKNLALDQPTNQSSTADFSSSLAVNGDYGDFSRTESGTFNWWTVSLQKQEKVVGINVLHLKVCCGQISIQNSIYTSLFSEPGSLSRSNGNWVQKYSRTQSTNWFHYSTNRMNREYVEAASVGVIGETNKALSLLEVEVFGYLETANIARDSLAIQSSDKYPGRHLASEAVNGILTDRAVADGATFWQVDLGAIYSCELIRFFNGQDFTEDNRTEIWFFIKEEPRKRFFGKRVFIDTERPKILNISFPSVRAIRFENRVILQPLIISEVEVFIAVNPAFNKPTKQATTFGPYSADLAVNGFNGDFSSTRGSDNPWWTVDLLEIHSIWSVDILSFRFGEKLYSVLLHTSKRHQQHTNFDQWTLANYRAREFELKETMHIPILLREARHIAIQINQSNSAFFLGEVIVNEFNFADRRLGVYQSSVYADDSNRFGPRKAVDYLYNTAAVSNYDTDSNQWWRLKLIEIILMTSIKIYFDGGYCIKSNRTVRCIELNSKINISTTNSKSGEDPSKWKLCHSQPYIQSPVHVGCDRNHRQPFTRHLIIQPQSNNFRIGLTEVEVFGRVLPRFASNAVASVHSVTHSSAQLTFHIWNSSNRGAIAPTTYRVTLNEGENLTTFRPTHAQSGRITANMNELNSSTSYEYEITCWIRSTQCLGRSIEGQFTTLSCPAPNRPNHTYSRINDGAKSRSFSIDVHDTDDNCAGSPKYRVTLDAGGVVLYNQSGQSHSITNVAKDIDLVFTSMITNRDGMSNSFNQYVDADRDVPAKPALKKFEFNSTCIHLQVSSEADFLFAKMLYKFACSYGGVVRQGSVNSPTTRKASQVFCGIAANSNGSCEVVVENNVGVSETLMVNSTPKVEPTEIINGATGTSEISTKKTEVSTTKPEKTAILVAVGAGSALLIIALIGVCWCFRRKKKTQKVDQLPTKRAKTPKFGPSSAEGAKMKARK